MSTQDETIHDEIARRRSEFSTSEQRVADLVLTLPDLPTKVSMRTLARHADVSDATVLRLCKMLGFAGYSDFKLAVARDCVPRPHPRASHTSREGQADRITRLVERVRLLGNDIVASGSLEAVDEIAERIAASDITYIFAFGASRTPGWDFMHQLHYCGLKASIESDPHIQALRVEGMNANSVAIFLSIGFPRLLGEMAEAARDMGAFTAAITTQGTPLATACDQSIFLPTSVRGQSGPPVDGRYAQLLVLDTIAERIAAGRPDTSIATPENVKSHLRFNY